jgi:hypothetical protein
MGSGKAQSNLTDRAKRYHANRDDVRPRGPKVCGYCGSTGSVEVDHIDGVEGHNWPQNLLWACRPCNTRKGLNFRRVGIGERTAQFNSSSGHGAISYSEWGELVDRVRGDVQASKPEVVAAVRKIQQTPERVRQQFAERMRRNPLAVASLADYLSTATAFQTFAGSDAFKGLDESVRRVMNTPRARYDRFAGAARRLNPSGRYPTYEQYGVAVAMHQRGSRDAGGAMIHATPPRIRSEYAARIAEVKRTRQGDVPF